MCVIMNPSKVFDIRLVLVEGCISIIQMGSHTSKKKSHQFSNNAQLVTAADATTAFCHFAVEVPGNCVFTFSLLVFSLEENYFQTLMF